MCLANHSECAGLATISARNAAAARWFDRLPQAKWAIKLNSLSARVARFWIAGVGNCHSAGKGRQCGYDGDDLLSWNRMIGVPFRRRSQI
jgi:hypothetical protein